MAAHYVDNAEFLEAMKKRREEVLAAKEKDLPKPQVSNYIGECIYKIAYHLSYKPNFINYSYRDEMVSDGIENCLRYIDNFDPAKSNNPFAYFTQIIYYAFLRRIGKEKKQSYIKNQLVQDMPFEMFDVMEGDDADYHNAYVEFLQMNNSFDDSFIKLKEKKKKKKESSLDEFLGE